MKVTNIRPAKQKGAICIFDIEDFYDMEGEKILRITKDYKLMDTNGEKWIAFPSRIYEEEGRRKYFSIEFIPSIHKKRFTEFVINKLTPFLNSQMFPQKDSYDLRNF